MLDLLHCGHQRMDEAFYSKLKLGNSENSKSICENQNILECLIDVACLLENHNLPFRSHYQADLSFNYMEFCSY
jgi:hypothetical protein